MPRQTRRVPLPSNSIGAQRAVLFHDYGAPDARPKAYLQAAIHAGEIPGLLVANHLKGLLDDAEAEGKITGRITLAPYANPIGLDQWINRQHPGRYELMGGGNFNRNWPDLTPEVAARLEGKLGADEADNVTTIRQALAEVVEAMPAVKEMEAWRRVIAREAIDADMVLDLHCDDDALMHVYMLAEHWPAFEDLHLLLGSRGTLLADDSGGGCFDEAMALPWVRLAKRFPEAAIPAACFATTVELRGQADVYDDLAAADAQALFGFLQRHGVIAGDPGPLPEPLCEATRLEACDVVKAPVAGVLAYKIGLGETVSKGQVIAELVNPAAEDSGTARTPVHSGTDGTVLTLQLHKYVSPGESIAKIVGKEPLENRKSGALVEM